MAQDKNQFFQSPVKISNQLSYDFELMLIAKMFKHWFYSWLSILKIARWSNGIENVITNQPDAYIWRLDILLKTKKSNVYYGNQWRVSKQPR